MNKNWLQQEIEKINEYDKGYDKGKKDATSNILGKLMKMYIRKEDLNDRGYGADETITMNDLLDLAEEYGIEI